MPVIQAGRYQVMVDPEDYARLKDFKWNAIGARGYKYAYTRIEGKSVGMHRLLMGATVQFVDHINGNTLDNRKENLRSCTHAENMRNRRKNSRSAQPFKGVEACRGKWRARITLNGRRIPLGLFDTAQAAYEAYCKASPVFHGDFGRTQ